LGGDTEDLVSPQREASTGFAEALVVSPQREDASTGFAAGGAAGRRHALLALSLDSTSFVGRESIKLDRAEAVMMVALCKEVAEDTIIIFYEWCISPLAGGLRSRVV
jgi:hypothetical protein